MTREVIISIDGNKVANIQGFEHGERIARLKTDRKFNIDLLNALYSTTERSENFMASVLYLMQNISKTMLRLEDSPHGLILAPHSMKLRSVRYLLTCLKFLHRQMPGRLDSIQHRNVRIEYWNHHIISGWSIHAVPHQKRLSSLGVLNIGPLIWGLYQRFLLMQPIQNNIMILTRLVSMLVTMNYRQFPIKGMCRCLTIYVTDQMLRITSRVCSNSLSETTLHSNV